MQTLKYHQPLLGKIVLIRIIRKQNKKKYGIEIAMTSIEMSSTFLTTVTDVPLLTSESAIHPPTFAVTAIVSHGKTAKSPDSVRLNFNTCTSNA